MSHAPLPQKTRGLTFLFAVAGGVAVGNLYWVQPLLAEIAAAFHLSAIAASSLVTATQIGYMIGIITIVPLGDIVDRRRFIPMVMAISAASLSICAMAPGYAALLCGLGLVGLTTVSGQLIMPLASELATADQRGRVVGTISSGMLTGILVSRTVSGLLADLLGWRAIYVAAAALTMMLAGVLSMRLPHDRPRQSIPYASLLASVIGVVRRYRTVQVTLVLGASAFGVFTMFWTGLTFLLSSAPFRYSTAQIGLVGLVGLAGALAARRAGRLHDLGLSAPAAGAALGLALLALVIAAIGASSILLLLLAVLLIDIAIQTVNVLNQTRLFAVDPTARSRLNTAFVIGNFSGGAIGSLFTGVIWQAGGWRLLVSVLAAIVLLALLVWAANWRFLGSEADTDGKSKRGAPA